jgi:Predicted membrane protein (DUF2339)
MSGEREQPARDQLDARLVRVERALDAVTREVTAIRAALDASRAAAPPPPRESVSRSAFLAGLGVKLDAASEAKAPAGGATAPKTRPAPRRTAAEQLDLESLLGRYGMLGIAVLAAIAAVVTFLSWAISKGYLTLPPGARVIVALVFATGIGAWGIRVRTRERPFGSSMVGLALVIVLVCGYAAGSWLRLVPPWVAFAGCIGVSWGLALFAHAEQDEPLWCVAFGGAAIAPFVTSSDEGNFFALVGYGAFLLFAASFAISHRAWPVAWRVFYFVSGFYAITAAVLSRDQGLAGFYAAFAFPIVVALVGVLPFAPISRKRAALRWFAILTVLVGFFEPHGANARGQPAQVTVALFGAAVLWLFLADRLDATKQSSLLATNSDNASALDWIDAGIVPLILVFQASSTIEPLASPGLIEGLGATMLLAFAARREIRPARDAAAAACAILTVAAMFQIQLEEPTGRLLAMLAIGAAAFIVNKARPSASWIATSVVVTVIAASISLLALATRPSYTYTPFTGEPSLTAACVTLFLILVSRFRGWIADATRPIVAARSDQVAAADLAFIRRIARLAPWVWAFVWVLIELGKAFSRSTSTLLLVIYFASTAVAAVAVGHIRHSAELRQLGLALALLAAATAVYGATTYFDVGARVLAYLVTSAFLLGIAYWYRRRTVPAA